MVARQPGPAALAEPLRGLAHGRLVVVDDRVAARRLVAGQPQRVEGQRIGVRRRLLLLQQAAEHPDLAPGRGRSRAGSLAIRSWRVAVVSSRRCSEGPPSAAGLGGPRRATAGRARSTRWRRSAPPPTTASSAGRAWGCSSSLGSAGGERTSLWSVLLPFWFYRALAGDRRDEPLLAFNAGAAIAGALVHFGDWPWSLRLGVFPWLDEAEGLPPEQLPAYNTILWGWLARRRRERDRGDEARGPQVRRRGSRDSAAAAHVRATPLQVGARAGRAGSLLVEPRAAGASMTRAGRRLARRAHEPRSRSRSTTSERPRSWSSGSRRATSRRAVTTR